MRRTTVTLLALTAFLVAPGVGGQTRPASTPAVKRELTWERPRFDEREAERAEMVRTQIKRRGVTDSTVLEAMRRVPRHRFAPPDQQRAAYADYPLPIGYGQTISQPYIVALMTEIVRIKPGDKVLEIGTGSGYQAAMCSELTPFVHSIEIVKKLGLKARKRLADLGYKTIKVTLGDGYHGLADQAPFDVIIVTCAATHIPGPLIDQLKPGGRMILPVGAYGVQYLVLVTKQVDGRVRSRNVLPVRFVPLTGGHRKPAAKATGGTR